MRLVPGHHGGHLRSQERSGKYGVLHTAMGLASIMAGYGAALLAAHFGGSFTLPHYLAAAFDFTAAILAFFALRPLVRGRIVKEFPKMGEVLKPA